MQTVTKKLFLHAKAQEYSPGEFSFEFYTCDMSEYGYIFLEEREITFEAPEFNQLIQREVERLNKTKADLRVKLAEELQKVNDRIIALTLLEAPRD